MMTPDFQLQPVHDVLIRGNTQMPVGLYHLHLATAAQLTGLHYSPKSIKLVQKRLKWLVDRGYLQADTIPTRELKSAYYYTLGERGMQYLKLLGYDVPAAWRAEKETNKHWLFIDHTRELNDLLISAALLNHPRYRLDHFIHERVLKRRPYRTTWRGRTLSVIPDAFLKFVVQLPDGTTEARPLLIEHDRGTEEQHHFRQRIRAYILLLKEEPTPIAFTTFVSLKRLEQMRSWTQTELAATNEPIALGLHFSFAYLQCPLIPEEVWLDPCWLSPYDNHESHLLLAA